MLIDKYVKQAEAVMSQTLVKFIEKMVISDLLLFLRLPTDIQAESIPLILGGGDVLMVRSLIHRIVSAVLRCTRTCFYNVCLHVLFIYFAGC